MDLQLLDLIGFWLGLLITLLLFSALFGDNNLARLGQHLLVGAALGYLGVLAIQNVLRPRLIDPLLADPTGQPAQWMPLIFGVILLAAGLDRTLRSPRVGDSPPLWRRALHGAGRLPVAFLVAVGLGAGIFGMIQGTFLPQFLAAAQVAFASGVPMGEFLAGVLMLLLTTATLLYLYMDVDRFLAGQPAWVQRLLRGWLWLGSRAIWFASGLIFARLMASRLSLLIARLDYLVTALYDSPVAAWLEGWLP